MSLTPPKRLFHVPSMSTVITRDVADDVKEKGYVAVSHVWGEQQLYPASKFSINGVNWEIPLSDISKISRLVGIMNHFKMKYCWFDILCMPQNRQDLINLEIPFMGDYYASAKMTFVLSDQEYIITEDYKKWNRIARDIVLYNKDITVDEIGWMHKKSDLLDFHKDQWFTRVWTLQEAVFSENLYMIGTKGYYINLSDIIALLLHLSKRIIDTDRFTSSIENLADIGLMKSFHTTGRLDLASAMICVVRRNCQRKQDRFYGVFGILGYKDFVVDYNIMPDDLNKRIIQHAYSKGDISWLPVGGNVTTSFIQPIYTEMRYLGDGWVEKTARSCLIGHDKLYIDMAEVGVVVSSRKFGNMTFKAIFTQVIKIFEDWGFNSMSMFQAIAQYKTISDEFTYIGERIIDGMRTGKKFSEVLEFISLFLRKEEQELAFGQVITTIENITKSHGIITIAMLSMNTGPMYPVIVSGDALSGNKVMVPKMLDSDDRCIGILISGTIRKGICLLPKEIYEHRSNHFSSHEFSL